MSYTVYLETLAKTNDYSPEWQSVAAGLVTLRLVDAWLDNGAEATRQDVQGLAAIRETVAAVSRKDPARQILVDMVELVAQSELAGIQMVRPRLLEYGLALCRCGQWLLAQEVYENLLDRAHALGDYNTLILTALRLGFVSRELGRFHSADTMYTLAQQTADRINDRKLYWIACGSLANTHSRLGNLSQADALLRNVVVEARERNCMRQIGLGLQDRSFVYGVCQDYAAALRFGQAARPYLSEASDRECLNGHIASCLFGLGELRSAKKILKPLAVTAHSISVRHTALLNLLEISVREGNESRFDQYRQELANDQPLPWLRAHQHLFLGQGYQKFGRSALAKTELYTALGVTAQYGFRQVGAMVRETLVQSGHRSSGDSLSSNDEV